MVVLLLNVANQLFSVYILLNELAVCLHSLQSSCTRDNFNELSGNDSLSSSVEFESQFFNHLTWKKRKLYQFDCVVLQFASIKIDEKKVFQ